MFDFSGIYLATSAVSIDPLTRNMTYRRGLTKEQGIIQNLITDVLHSDDPGPSLIIHNVRLVNVKLHIVTVKIKKMMYLNVK